MTNLIKRLGASCYLAFEDGTNDYSAAQEAIDRIEELVKEKTALNHLCNAIFNSHIKEITVAEAKLAKAVEALVQLERIVGDILGAHLQDSESRDKAIDLIKTTLAELGGGENESH